MNLLQLHEPGETPAPHASDAARAIGIDLGTTHSVVAVSRDGQVEVIRRQCGEALIPSVVWYGENETHVGLDARAKYAHGDARAVASIKRHMNHASQRFDIGGKSLTPVEISADILRELKRMAEAALDHEVTQAVITVPAYFDDAARTATKDAARLAGLTVLRLINEPTSAALAYGLDKSAEGIYAIYDLGGGTFDISLLKLEKGVFQVLATGGDTQLGGDDFDREIANQLFGATDGASLSKARSIKEKLSAQDSYEGLSRQQFDALIAPYVEKTAAICRRVMQDAKLSASSIHGVVLVGGSTRIPLVREKVAAIFGRQPLTDVNPDEVVAVGAALQAEALTQGSDTLLLDVIPLSLGLETMGGLVEKLIYRNTAIPVSVMQEFTTYQDNQTGMQIHVLQGEREMVGQNRSLAHFELAGIPALPAGIARVAITFTVDADGLLTVNAKEAMTETAQTVHVKPSYGLEPDEIERMLLESMQHAKADILERLVTEARVEAERSILELESALKQDGELLSDAERKRINLQIGYVREAIREQDRERIDAEVMQLGHMAQPFAEKRMDKAITSALKGADVHAVETALAGEKHA